MVDGKASQIGTTCCTASDRHIALRPRGFRGRSVNLWGENDGVKTSFLVKTRSENELATKPCTMAPVERTGPGPGRARLAKKGSRGDSKLSQIGTTCCTASVRHIALRPTGLISKSVNFWVENDGVKTSFLHHSYRFAWSAHTLIRPPRHLKPISVRLSVALSARTPYLSTVLPTGVPHSKETAPRP